MPVAEFARMLEEKLQTEFLADGDLLLTPKSQYSKFFYMCLTSTGRDSCVNVPVGGGTNDT